MDKPEELLRQIVEVQKTPQNNLFEWIKTLESAIEEARMYLHQLDRCEFHSENGWRCNEKKVRTVHGICCCEEHAKERARYFGE